jgi:ATP-dependent RNA helicase DDX1
MLDSGKEHAYSCCVLAGMRSMQERRMNLEAFKEGAVRFLICTDVAARGIDIKNLPFVINMTLPDEAENYIHRIGRVGRAERMGLAISIVAGNNVKEKVWYHKCNNRGKGCNNRSDPNEGGCTEWYNESELLKKVEQRLRQPVAELIRGTYDLPQELAELGTEYGEDAKQAGGVANIHLQLLGPTVAELGKMEIMAQNNFLDLLRPGRFKIE